MLVMHIVIATDTDTHIPTAMLIVIICVGNLQVEAYSHLNGRQLTFFHVMICERGGRLVWPEGAYIPCTESPPPWAG